MIETKLFELRDAATFIPIIASRMRAVQGHDAPTFGIDDVVRERWLLRRAGYSDNDTLVLVTCLEGGQRTHYSPEAWGGRTLPVAHQYIRDHWDDLSSGDMLDVRYILGETIAPCETEQVHG